MSATEWLNRCARAADQTIEAYLGARRIPDELRYGIFLRTESRLRRGREPALRVRDQAAIDLWAQLAGGRKAASKSPPPAAWPESTRQALRMHLRAMLGLADGA